MKKPTNYSKGKVPALAILAISLPLVGLAVCSLWAQDGIAMANGSISSSAHSVSVASSWRGEKSSHVNGPAGLDVCDLMAWPKANSGFQPGLRAGGESTEIVNEVGSPFHIGGAPVYGLSGHTEHYPAVGFDGTNYLVVWRDDSNCEYGIAGARVTVGGTVFDPAGFPIATATGNQNGPAIAFDGRNYLVVWEDRRGSSNYDIYGARVTVDGNVLDPAGIAISTVASDQSAPAIAFDGTNYLVVWLDWRSGSKWEVYGARVTTDGSVLDPSGTLIGKAGSVQFRPAVASDGTDYLVVWEGACGGFARAICGARVSLEGAVLDSTAICISTAAQSPGHPAVAFDGSNYLVVWEDWGTSSYDVYGSRVTVDGSVLDPSGIAISAASGGQSDPVIAFDEANYLVVWQDGRSGSYSDIYGARVAVDGSVSDPSGVAISTAASEQGCPAVAFDGTNYLVVLESFRHRNNWDIYGARISVDGSVLDPSGIAISTTATEQDRTAVAFDGANHLVVWVDTRSVFYSDIYGARVAGDGSVLDSSRIAISTALQSQFDPAVAFDGVNYLVVWADSRSGSYSDIYGARVAVDGSILDPSGIAICNATNSQNYPAVAFDGVNYLVVWEDYRNGPDEDVYGARVGVDGSVLDPSGIAISVASADQKEPAIAFDGTNYLVVWWDNRDGPYWDIYGARVAVDGIVLDSSGIVISAAANEQSSPEVAFDGTNYLVVWTDHRSDPHDDVYGARMTTYGSVLDIDGIPISTAPQDQDDPAVAFDGVNYLVVWADSRSGFPSDIYGARVTVSGGVLDPLGIRISTAECHQLRPSISAGIMGRSLITYSSFTPAPIYSSQRIWGNFYYDEAAGVATELRGPECLQLLEDFPNPFVGLTTVRFYLTEEEQVSLKVYDARGHLVRIIFDGISNAGAHQINWDGKSGNEAEVAPGIYFIRMESGSYRATRKVVLLR